MSVRACVRVVVPENAHVTNDVGEPALQFPLKLGKGVHQIGVRLLAERPQEYLGQVLVCEAKVVMSRKGRPQVHCRPAPDSVITHQSPTRDSEGNVIIPELPEES